MYLYRISLPAGEDDISFNAHALPSGIYFYRIEADEFQDVKKMILLR
ncbi:T9SS type A sorting domain-containing protein [bacterium]|nr:T9SS type A sorting domain-containing protein [bacterium]